MGVEWPSWFWIYLTFFPGPARICWKHQIQFARWACNLPFLKHLHGGRANVNSSVSRWFFYSQGPGQNKAGAGCLKSISDGKMQPPFVPAGFRVQPESIEQADRPYGRNVPEP